MRNYFDLIVDIKLQNGGYVRCLFTRESAVCCDKTENTFLFKQWSHISFEKILIFDFIACNGKKEEASTAGLYFFNTRVLPINKGI